MAALTAPEFAPIRQRLADLVRAPHYRKAQVNAAVQAVEDWFEANQPALGTAIETAAPGVFSAAQKRLLVRAWLLSKFERGG